MSITNGSKMFLYVVKYSTIREGISDQLFLVRSDHDPTAGELSRLLLNLEYDTTRDTFEAQRYDIESLPVVPPKNP